MKHISKYLENRPQLQEPLMSGYDFIDNELGGYHPGELMTICGVEDCGKTAFDTRIRDMMYRSHGLLLNICKYNGN